MSSRYSRPSHHTTSTTTQARSRPLWDPKEVLGLEYTNCCVGYAASKGRRCECAVAQANSAKAEALLDDISRCESEAECLREDLLTIATCLLCVRWHRGQADRMVDKWMDLIEDTFEEEEEEEEDTFEEEEEEDTFEEEEEEEEEIEDLISVARRLGSSYRTPTRPTPSPSIATAIRCSQTWRTTTSASSSSPLSSSSRATTPNSSHHNHSTTITSSATPISRVPTSNTPSLSLRRSSSSSTSSSSSSSPPATPTPPPNPPRKHCNQTHVARREMDSDCAICMEPMSRSQNPVWCKTGCGRSVHKDCFATWKTERLRRQLSVNCAICRARWDDTECEC